MELPLKGKWYSPELYAELRQSKNDSTPFLLLRASELPLKGRGELHESREAREKRLEQFLESSLRPMAYEDSWASSTEPQNKTL